MNPLEQTLTEYLSIRRSLGFRLREPETSLRNFVAFLQAEGASYITRELALRWATQGSAACIGRPELGEIAVGKAADLALFKLDELRFSGHGDPLAALVLCGAHRADRVMVGGKWVVSDGAIAGLDLADLIQRHSAAARAIQI